MPMKKNLPSKNSKYILFSVQIGKKKVMIERNDDWEINITQAAKLLNKRWRDWQKWNSEVIKTFEILEGRTLIKKVGPKNKQQTFLSLILALRVLNDYNPVLSYQIFKLSKPNKIKTELENYRKKLEIAEATIAKLENKPIDVDLGGGKFLLYGYECNKKVKFGTSFCNKNGQRPKSHKTSVPNLAIGFVIYSSKENLQILNRVIKNRFNIKSKNEHIDCEIIALEKFVFDYSDLMRFDYKKEDIHRLTLLNIFLK